MKKRYTDHIMHSNAEPEFFKNKEAMEALEKMGEAAYNMKFTKGTPLNDYSADGK